jgi:hypothetical protein
VILVAAIWSTFRNQEGSIHQKIENRRHLIGHRKSLNKWWSVTRNPAASPLTIPKQFLFLPLSTMQTRSRTAAANVVTIAKVLKTTKTAPGKIRKTVKRTIVTTATGADKPASSQLTNGVSAGEDGHPLEVHLQIEGLLSQRRKQNVKRRLRGRRHRIQRSRR